MKINFLFLLFASCFIGFSANAFTERNVAVVRVMNKAAGKAQTLKMPVGQNSEFEKLTIDVKSCKQTDPFEPENFYMFVVISKNQNGQIFSGWMNKNEPGDNPLQNADYDMWLIGCE